MHIHPFFKPPILHSTFRQFLFDKKNKKVYKLATPLIFFFKLHKNSISFEFIQPARRAVMLKSLTRKEQAIVDLLMQGTTLKKNCSRALHISQARISSSFPYSQKIFGTYYNRNHALCRRNDVVLKTPFKAHTTRRRSLSLVTQRFKHHSNCQNP